MRGDLWKNKAHMGSEYAEIFWGEDNFLGIGYEYSSREFLMKILQLY